MLRTRDKRALGVLRSSYSLTVISLRTEDDRTDQRGTYTASVDDNSLVVRH